MSEKLNKSEDLVLSGERGRAGELRARRLLEEQEQYSASDSELDQEQARQEAYAEVLSALDKSESGPEKMPVDEMEPVDVAKEYLDLLQKLSADFDKSDKKGNYSINAHKMEGLSSAEKREIDNNLGGLERKDKNAMSFADGIIHGEVLWRTASDQAVENERVQKELDDLKSEHDKKSLLKRLFSHRAYKKQELAIKQSHRHLAVGVIKVPGAITSRGNEQIATQLYKVYGDYEYGGGLSNEKIEKYNQEYSDKFFSDERMPDIDRAVELYKKLHTKEFPKR